MSISNFISGFLGNSFKERIFEQGHEFIYRAKLEMWRFQKKLIKTMAAVFILLLSFAILGFSLIFYLIDYIHLSRALSFLIIGIILLIIGVILKL